MKPALALLALGLVACSGDTSSDQTDGDPGGGGPISTEQCTFTPRAGSVTGMGRPTVNDTLEPFSYSEAFCQSLRRRDGSFSRLRFAFGTYDPMQPGAVFPLAIESMIGTASATLSNAPVYAHLILPSGKRNWNGGRVTFDPATRHGSFSDDYDLMHFTFDCDPHDDISDAPGPAAPDHAAPGTAIVTRAPSDYVVVLDGLRCFSSATTPLWIERIDHGPDCSFSQLSLDATTSEPTLGVGTYPGEYSPYSTIDTVGEMRIADPTTSPGTLDISTGPPWTGFATFPEGANGSPDRVEFACAE
jgi:hypothetical protein